jgi:hypothetical protein
MGDYPGGIVPSLTPNGEAVNRPVWSVSWYDAIVFCNTLSIAEGLTPAYRMATEAEPSETDKTKWSTTPQDWGTVPSMDDLRWNAVECIWDVNGYRLPT